MTIISNLRRIFDHATGYIDQALPFHSNPYSDTRRLIPFDPVDWAQINYFKDCDYAPPAERYLGHYYLNTEKCNGLYNLQISILGELEATVPGGNSFGLNPFTETAAPSVMGMTKREVTLLIDAFENGVPLVNLIPDAQQGSFLEQIVKAEAAYSFCEIATVRDHQEWYARYSAMIAEWGLPERYLSNPDQDGYHENRRKKVNLEPAL